MVRFSDSDKQVQMRLLTLTCLLLSLIVAGCGSGIGHHVAPAAPADTSRYYPLESFYRAQIEYVDLRNFPIYRIRTIDGKKDSAAMSKDEFVAFAKGLFYSQTFRPEDKRRYRESVFEDESTDSYTLNYAALDTDLVVRSVDILLNRQSNAVKRVFVKSFYRPSPDTLVEQVFSLKADKSMQLSKTITADNYNRTELNYINWNDRLRESDK
jgi:hypothetical protein